MTEDYKYRSHVPRRTSFPGRSSRSGFDCPEISEVSATLRVSHPGLYMGHQRTHKAFLVSRMVFFIASLNMFPKVSTLVIYPKVLLSEKGGVGVD